MEEKEWYIIRKKNKKFDIYYMCAFLEYDFKQKGIDSDLDEEEKSSYFRSIILEANMVKKLYLEKGADLYDKEFIAKNFDGMCNIIEKNGREFYEDDEINNDDVVAFLGSIVFFATIFAYWVGQVVPAIVFWQELEAELKKMVKNQEEGEGLDDLLKQLRSAVDPNNLLDVPLN